MSNGSSADEVVSDWISQRDLAVKVVKFLRIRLGWSQEKTARKLGVSFKTIVRWEQDKSLPSPLAVEAIIKLAHEEVINLEQLQLMEL